MIKRAPAAVRAVAPLERRLAWALTTDGTPVVATHLALHAGSVTLPWTSVEKAVWAVPVLTVRELAEVDGAGASHRFTLVDGHRLAETVRASVTSSVAWSDIRRLVPAGRVRVVGRRVPGQDSLLWQVVWLDGTDPADELLRAQAESAVAALRGSLG